MPRIKFEKGHQLQFLSEIRECLGWNWSSLAHRLEVQPRTLLTWRKEEYKMPKKAFDSCLDLTRNKVVPFKYKVLPDFWHIREAGRKGAISRMNKYGMIGDLESRRKGGFASQEMRRLFPHLYKNCNIRRMVRKPRQSKDLAELFGIILGDGTINRYQVSICLNSQTDKAFGVFVTKLFKQLFNINASIYSPKKKNCFDVCVSSSDLVNFLGTKGLSPGNKVKKQVSVPRWIIENDNFSLACIRGLVDTDGCVFFHRHKVGGRNQFNIGLDFSNRSVPLLNFVKSTLKGFGFHPKITDKDVRLYRFSEVMRYEEIIGFSNLRHKKKIKEFLRIKRRGVANW